MVSDSTCPCTVLLTARERRSDERHEAFGQPESFWTTFYQMVTPAVPFQGHRPTSRR